MIAIEYFIGLSAILFIIGAVGVLTRKSAIVVLMCIELMLNAANINFVAFSAYSGNRSTFSNHLLQDLGNCKQQGVPFLMSEGIIHKL